MTIALNCLVFEKITFLDFGDRQTDRQTDGQLQCIKQPLPTVSGGLIAERNKYSCLQKIEIISSQPKLNKIKLFSSKVAFTLQPLNVISNAIAVWHYPSSSSVPNANLADYIS